MYRQVMLLRVIIGDFLSYREETQFDMFPNFRRQTLNEHIYQAKVPVLKQAAIYGGNGTGKSNLIHAMGFIQEFATNPAFLSSIDLSNYFHLLVSDKDRKNIHLTVEFSYNEIYYLYEIEISTEAVELESLHVSGIGRRRSVLVFKRSKNSFSMQSIPNESIKKAIDDLVGKNPMSSLLSLNSKFPILNSEHAVNAYKWFKDSLVIVPLYSGIAQIINLMYRHSDLLRFTQDTFKNIDLGIDDVKVSYELADEYFQKHIQNQKNVNIDSIINQVKPNIGVTAFRDNKPVLDIILENGVKKVGEMIMSQQGVGNILYDMNLGRQSDGTIRLLMLMPVFYDIQSRDVTVFVDEINHPIHPLLIKRLVKLFADNKNSKGQLIYTTHETELLDNTFMRTDEVWLTEKHEGATKLYSLNEFKLHRNIGLKTGYLEGRFGGVPMLKKIAERFEEI